MGLLHIAEPGFSGAAEPDWGGVFARLSLAGTPHPGSCTAIRVPGPAPSMNFAGVRHATMLPPPRAEGDTPIPAACFDEDGELDSDAIFCAKCGQQEADDVGPAGRHREGPGWNKGGHSLGPCTSYQARPLYSTRLPMLPLPPTTLQTIRHALLM